MIESLQMTSTHTPVPDKRFPMTGGGSSPHEAYIKKRVASQLTTKRVPGGPGIGAGLFMTPKTSNGKARDIRGAASSSMSHRQQFENTDYIELNKRMSTLSRNMGKEVTWGGTSFKIHQKAMLNQQ